MKVKLITEIDVHEDGVHCGEDCPQKHHKEIYSDDVDINYCQVCGCTIYDSKRREKCLAAQKEAEGMRAMKRSDFDIVFNSMCTEVDCYAFPELNTLLDRFYPVPQEANDEPSDGRGCVPIDSEDTRGE